MKFDSKEQFEQLIKDKLNELSQSHNWNAENLLTLKDYISSTNNHITYLMGEKFLEQLNSSTIEANFNYPEMNNNGYDLAFSLNKSTVWIVAEIKGNIPCCSNKTRYGAQQKEKLSNDIKNLTKNKSTSQITDEQFEDAYKFLVLLKNNKEAIKTLINNKNFTKKISYEIKILDDNNFNLTALNKNTIHIVLIDL